ncbi:BrnA antitoxin family protein [Microcystis aeruginosa]|nr:BrnA antitoxin family protein [Microcystis aeruginosa]
MSKKSIKSDLKRIDAMTDENIDYSDIPPLGDEFLTQETVSFSTSKQQLTIQLDQDILEWLKAQGKGYETQIN